MLFAVLVLCLKKRVDTITQENVPWNLDRIDQRDGLDGKFKYPASKKTVTVYVVDSGIRKDPEFKNRVETGINFTDEPDGDFLGHGTMVASLIGSQTYGIAKHVKLVDVKVVNKEGTYSTEVVFDALEWIRLDAKKRKGPVLVNFSATSEDDAALNDGIEYLNEAIKVLYEQGIPVVVAAGNDGRDACLEQPTSSEEAISVGMTNKEDQRSSFSNKGPCIDILAPGADVIGLGLEGKTKKTGCSFAAPLVAGVAAHYLSAGIGVKDLKEALIFSSTKNILKLNKRDKTANRLLYLSTNILEEFYSK